VGDAPGDAVADPIGCDAPGGALANRAARLIQEGRSPRQKPRRSHASPGSGTAASGRTIPKYLRSSSVS